MTVFSTLTDMQIDLLTETGKAMYGERWQTDIANDLGVDKRRVQHWIAGTRPIPSDLAQKLVDLLNAKSQHFDSLIDKLIADKA